MEMQEARERTGWEELPSKFRPRWKEDLQKWKFLFQGRQRKDPHLLDVQLETCREERESFNLLQVAQFVEHHTKHHILDKIFLEEAMFTRGRWVDWREVQTQYPGRPWIFNHGVPVVSIGHKVCAFIYKGNQVCRYVAFVADMLVLMTRPCQKAGERWNTKMAVGDSLSSRQKLDNCEIIKF